MIKRQDDGMRSEEDINRAIGKYADMVKRICVLHLKNHADTEDIFQTVFLKYALHTSAFQSEEHEKAWLIRVTLNACRDLLRSFFRSRTVPLEEIARQAAAADEESRDVLRAVLQLPEKYRRAIYLHYYEGYTAPQIGRLLGKNTNTVYTLLTRGRQLLKQELGGDGDGK